MLVDNSPRSSLLDALTGLLAELEAFLARRIGVVQLLERDEEPAQASAGGPRRNFPVFGRPFGCGFSALPTAPRGSHRTEAGKPGPIPSGGQTKRPARYNCGGWLSPGTWHDFESDTGGGVLDLVRRERQCDQAGALDWLHRRRITEWRGPQTTPKSTRGPGNGPPHPQARQIATRRRAGRLRGGCGRRRSLGCSPSMCTTREPFRP